MNVSAKDLRRAANLQEKIEALENELSQILGYIVGNGKKSGGDSIGNGKTAPKERKGRRKMSAAGRAKIAAAAKARWAAAKKAGKNSL